HAAEVAVVADDERNRTAGCFGQRARVRRVDVEPDERFGQVRRLVEHAVTLERPGNRQTDALDLLPAQPVVLQVLVDGRHPALDDGSRPFGRSRRPLQQTGRDDGAVAPDGAHLRRRCSPVGADEHVSLSRHCLLFRAIRSAGASYSNRSIMLWTSVVGAGPSPYNSLSLVTTPARPFR